jgi:hypothetical protein
MEEIGNSTGNQGGGHDGAAGLNGTGRADKVLSVCINEMTSLLSKKLGIVDPGKGRSRSGRKHGSGSERDQNVN